MSAPRLAGLAMALVLLLATRDWLGAVATALDPNLGTAVLRLSDLAYAAFYGLALWLLFKAPGFTRWQRLAGLALQLLVLASFASLSEPGARFRSMREAVFPLAFLVAGAVVGRDEDAAPGDEAAALRWPAALLVLSIAVGAWQMFTVRSVADYWFYRHMFEAGDALEEFNLIRDGHARGTGLGVSPFSLGYLGLGLGMVAYVRRALSPTPVPFWRDGTFLLLYTGGLLACLIADARLAAVSLLAIAFLDHVRIPPVVVTLAAGAGVYLYGAAFIESSEDTSLYGRITQWGLAFAEGMLGHPFGAPVPTGPASIWFDSYFLNFTVSFGFAALACLVVFVALFSRGTWRHGLTFSIVAVLFSQCLMQALEYTVFLPLALYSLGLSCDARRAAEAAS